MALDIIAWMWGTKYSPIDVIKLANQVKRNLHIEHKFHLFTDVGYTGFPDWIIVHQIMDKNLLDKSCYCRLRMFDPAWQFHCGFNDTIISLDLDLVITGRLDSIFNGKETFKILQGVNSSNPNPFNASIMQLKAGCHPNVWKDFSEVKASKVPYFKFPDDQGWIHHMLPNASGWKPGSLSGIYAFKKPGWPGGSMLPIDASIVAFIGYRKPNQFGYLPWVQKYWANAA